MQEENDETLQEVKELNADTELRKAQLYVRQRSLDVYSALANDTFKTGLVKGKHITAEAFVKAYDNLAAAGVSVFNTTNLKFPPAQQHKFVKGWDEVVGQIKAKNDAAAAQKAAGEKPELEETQAAPQGPLTPAADKSARDQRRVEKAHHQPGSGARSPRSDGGKPSKIQKTLSEDSEENIG